MLIINGTVHTMEGLTIPGGYVDIHRRDRPHGGVSQELGGGGL